MNLPNILTLFRLVLAALFVICLSFSIPWHNTAALIIFLLASLTDYLDGEIARRMNLITDFGKLMDPLADKILTASAFICLITFGLVPAWVVIVIISREFLITGLRLLASSKGIIMPAEKLGKHKTAWQMITIIYYLGLLSAAELLPSFILNPPNVWITVGNVLTTIAAALTVYSGLAYFWKNRQLIQSAH